MPKTFVLECRVSDDSLEYAVVTFSDQDLQTYKKRHERFQSANAADTELVEWGFYGMDIQEADLNEVVQAVSDNISEEAADEVEACYADNRFADVTGCDYTPGENTPFEWVEAMVTCEGIYFSAQYREYVVTTTTIPASSLWPEDATTKEET